MRLIEKYSRKILFKRMAGNQRTVRLSPINQLKKIGILWREDDVKAYNFLMENFKRRSLIIRNICYSESKNASGSNILTPRDFDWLGFPKEGKDDTFISLNFDLLINLSVKSCYPLEVITALSVASFKTGWDMNNLGLYDLSIDVSKQPDALFLAEQQLYYLTKLTKSDDEL